MFGQEEGTGIVPPDIAATIRAQRNSEPWERYDSIVVGPNAHDVSRGWFNSFAALTAATEITLFTGRESAVGGAYCNTQNERADWRQDFYGLRIECVAPIGMAEYESVGTDADVAPLFWTREMPSQAWASVFIADSDEIAKFPLLHAPSGYGVTGMAPSALAAPTVVPGQAGDANVSTHYRFPEPIMLAAKAAFKVVVRFDQPIRTLLGGIAGPGSKLIPDGAGGVIAVPNWFAIRATVFGPRYMQLRGARSA